MKCELGAESLRPRWGRRGAEGGGLRGTNSRLCWRGLETPRPPVIPPPSPPPPPPPLRSDSRPVRSFAAASGAAAALASDDLWKRGQIAMWGSTPQRPRELQQTPAVRLRRSSGFIYVARRVD